MLGRQRSPWSAAGKLGDMKINDLRPVAIVLLALAGAVGCSATSKSAKPATASGTATATLPPAGVAEGGSRIDFPSYGISVPVPAGYVRDTDAMDSVVIFVRPGQVG